VIHIVIEVVFESDINLIIRPFGIDWITKVVMLSYEVGNWNSIDLMNWNNWNDCTSVSLFVLGIRTIVELFPDSCLENLSIMENLL